MILLCLTYFNIQTQEREFVLKISALEIYNETVVDLLNRESGPLRLLDDPEVCKFMKSAETISNFSCRISYISMVTYILFDNRKGPLWRS